MALNLILRIIPSDLFNKTNIMNKSLNENLCVTKIKYIMYNVQYMLFLFSKPMLQRLQTPQ
jgi:hypothetical protein